MHSEIREHLEKEQDHNIHENVDIVEKDICLEKNYVLPGVESAPNVEKKHFSIKCNELRESASRWQRSRNVNQVEYSEYNEYEDDEYETIMMVKGTEEVQERDGREEKTSIKANMLIIGQETVTDVVFQIDSGATINVVPKTVLPPEIQLEDCGNELKTWNN